ncbi:aminoglycoside phosphotransferase family protein [Streptomyces sp. 351MFTsu5.1]|uniref:aminoglycoside phosphotransferase family protein n=1 Tax=Streptomyces sp. 351MFTsu5.1 TaxID=1172180 RepID=UPI00036932ED|nr:aminoglycoside phosphotransferase family protein [Streptomyces sp. 351MFTsu5.1]
MASQLVSSARRRAEELADDASVVQGPLEGYHHETYALALPGGTRIVKLREPRAEILWFDRRYFRSEEELLRALCGRISGIPDVLDCEGIGLQSFIEGRTVGWRVWNRRIPDAVFDQIVDLFRELVWVAPDTLEVERRCEERDHPEEGDCAGFLECLIDFAEQQVFERNRQQFGELFHELGVGNESFGRLRKHVAGLQSRPFSLLHADLHRKNLIVDSCGRLWAIDWELASVGDPLYDLATHLYLMRYPSDQDRRMIQRWCRVVERARPGSSSGWERDLPLILDFKRAQSVFTDVIRVSLALDGGPGQGRAALPYAARKLQRILAAAAVPLGMETVPPHAQIMAALARRQHVAARECA